mmetsp:Transcript_39976/g.70323  ORF Transcript_39976/g.70323 Transcript_39976/m.70323 type:complete len:437 (-) Transcript_39976:199-1509(-)
MDRPGPASAPMHDVQVVSSTWARDSHDLFDFEAHHLHTKTLTVQRSMTCIRNGTDVQMLGQHVSPPPGSEQLLRLVQKDGTFWVDKASPSSGSKKLWLVVRDLSTCGQKLTEGDIIKLGRFKFRVRQMVASESDGLQPELRLDDTGVMVCTDPRANDMSQIMCRICLLEGSSEDDPLITPCQCKGSIEHVHLGCLRHWIKGRLNLSDSSTSFFYKPLACELCKAVYPAYLHVGPGEKDRVPLVEVPRTQPPFIALENMVRDSHQHSCHGLHVVSLADNKLLKLGRGHECDVRIADVSISRCHATIRFHRGQFVLEDHNSKFGTLIAMKKPRALEANGAISIQVGRTVLSLSLQPRSDGSPAGMQPYGFQSPTSSAQDERALRLSLLTRNSNQSEEENGMAPSRTTASVTGPDAGEWRAGPAASLSSRGTARQEHET